MRLPLELPDIEDLPQTVCFMCGKSKIMGLFTPAELKRGGGAQQPQGPRCRSCVGELSEKSRKNTWRRNVEAI